MARAMLQFDNIFSLFAAAFQGTVSQEELLKSAKAGDACRQSGKELRCSLGGALNRAAVLRVFRKRLARANSCQTLIVF